MGARGNGAFSLLPNTSTFPGIRIAIKMDMIEKLTSFPLTEQLRTRALAPTSHPGASSPFSTILNQEMNTLAPLETMVLNYLIKTIEFVSSLIPFGISMK